MLANVYAVAGAIATVLWLIGIVVYRLLLHPLAKFPGRKLAALTTWYEGYYDIVHKGRYLWQIEEMHKKYGPVVRVGPNELHIKGSSYYNTLYNMSNRLDKDPYYYALYGLPDAAFSTIRSDLHRMRRHALNPFFTLKEIQVLSQKIQALSERLTDRMKLCQKSGEPIPLFFAYRCLSVDLISEHIFGRPIGLLDRDDWGKSFYAAWRSTWDLSPLLRQLPWLLEFLINIPHSLAKVISPEVIDVVELRDTIVAWTKEIIEEKEQDVDGKEGKDDLGECVVKRLSKSELLPPHEKTVKRIATEVHTLFGAGFETTGAVLTHMTFMVLSHRHVYDKLMKELQEAIPDPEAIPPWQTLEKLPYLYAVVKESLRHEVGPFARLTRKLHTDMTYRDDLIPAGSSVGMSALFVERDPEIFPDPEAFIPERWLEPGAAAKLERYLLAFGKGPRACVGMHVAYAELYSVLATVFRRFGDKLELYKTTWEDVEPFHEYFGGMIRWGPGREGVLVIIKQ